MWLAGAQCSLNAGGVSGPDVVSGDFAEYFHEPTFSSSSSDGMYFKQTAAPTGGTMTSLPRCVGVMLGVTLGPRVFGCDARCFGLGRAAKIKVQHGIKQARRGAYFTNFPPP